MAYSRQWLVGVLRELGYSHEADEALRDLPDDFDRKRLMEFADQHGLGRDELVNRMGGSP
jgi:hypothetical protein